MEEVEVKFLAIEPKEIERKLKKIGAKKVGQFFYRRRVFDYPDLGLDKQGAWLRLRDEGNRTTLTFKQRLGISSFDGRASDKSMEEIEIVVDDFEKTGKLLAKVGFKEKFYEENKRIRYQKGKIEFDIDFLAGLRTIFGD